jgi:hypothetical protein
MTTKTEPHVPRPQPSPANTPTPRDPKPNGDPGVSPLGGQRGQRYDHTQPQNPPIGPILERGPCVPDGVPPAPFVGIW